MAYKKFHDDTNYANTRKIFNFKFDSSYPCGPAFIYCVVYTVLSGIEEN